VTHDVHVPVPVGVEIFALQVAVDPPFEPLQDQDQGPLPATALAVPALQRLVGTPESVCPFEDPQAPLIGVVDTLQEAVVAITLRSPRLVYHGQ
jgi:hypothetical protein